MSRYWEIILLVLWGNSKSDSETLPLFILHLFSYHILFLSIFWHSFPCRKAGGRELHSRHFITVQSAAELLRVSKLSPSVPLSAVQCLGLVRLGVTDGEPRRWRLARDHSQSHADCRCSLSNLRQITANLPRPASSGEFGSVTANTTETRESLWMWGLNFWGKIMVGPNEWVLIQHGDEEPLQITSLHLTWNLWSVCFVFTHAVYKTCDKSIYSIYI